MPDDNRGLTSLGEISFISFMARLLPALGVNDNTSPARVAWTLGVPPTPRNLALIDDIQSYRRIVWAELPISTRIEIAFGDTGSPSDFDFYFEHEAVTEGDLFG